MAYVTHFVKQSSPVTDVQTQMVGTDKKTPCLSYWIGSEYVMIHFDTLSSLERFTALVNSAVEDLVRREDSDEPVAASVP